MFYLTGDIHRNIYERFNELNYPILKNIKKEDYIIVLGDFGIIWYGDERDDKLLNWLEREPYNILFVEGNHCNIKSLFSRDTEDWNGGKIHRLRKNIIHLTRGQVYTINNKKFFTFGGGNSIDKEFRIKDLTWWEEEMPSIEEKEAGLINLEKHKWKVDYVLTHDCPREIFFRLSEIKSMYPIVDDLKLYLDKIYHKLSYKKWFFGHYHDYIILKNKYYLLYNQIIKLE